MCLPSYHVFALHFIFQNFTCFKYSGLHLPCTLWGDYATQIFEYSTNHKNSTVVCVFRFVCIKEYKGTSHSIYL